MTLSSIHQEIYQVVALIPYGKVATYGQIARLAGLPKHARLVGYALNQLAADNELPWYRVINSQGKISLQKLNEQAENIQKIKLEQEGIIFQHDKVSLKDYQWQP